MKTKKPPHRDYWKSLRNIVLGLTLTAIFAPLALAVIVLVVSCAGR